MPVGPLHVLRVPRRPAALPARRHRRPPRGRAPGPRRPRAGALPTACRPALQPAHAAADRRGARRARRPAAPSRLAAASPSAGGAQRRRAASRRGRRARRAVARARVFFSGRRRHTRWNCDWSSDVCSSDLIFGLRYTVRQLELAQLKSGFVSNVTHELKTPIALIKLAVETLEMGRFRSPDESQKFLHSIGREAVQLTQLVDNILDFARLESGRVTFRLERLDPAAVVREALETYRPRLDDQGFKVDVEIPDRLPEVRADGRALSHAVLNLLDNAVKYSRQRREVRISAGARDGAVRISVADRGLGIAAGDQKKVFDKFVRLETGLVHDVKGAGLGLALVHQIVRAHGGRVELVSTPGEGSTFTLVLPIAEGESAAPNNEERALTG